MELSIRSQNKEVLTKYNCLAVEERQGKYTITNYVGLDFYYCIGTYETKERALEVLDEIQKIFDFRIENKNYQEADLLVKANMFPKIYQMPKD